TIENIATATPEKPITPPVVTPPTETKIPGKVKPELPKDPKTKESEKGILPKTGEVAAIWMIELGTVMLCLAGYFIYRKRQ
ncbi:LPXTG cell wall anchor domain-containing protein, partial [Enterococcus faecalis]